jgi:hypothetical protein
MALGTNIPGLIVVDPVLVVIGIIFPPLKLYDKVDFRFRWVYGSH